MCSVALKAANCTLGKEVITTARFDFWLTLNSTCVSNLRILVATIYLFAKLC